MCIEVVIERGVLETEGVGGYFVCRLGSDGEKNFTNFTNLLPCSVYDTGVNGLRQPTKSMLV